MRGFEFCRCEDAIGGGHPAWRCKACDRVRTLGGVGAVPVSNDCGGGVGSREERDRTGLDGPVAATTLNLR